MKTKIQVLLLAASMVPVLSGCYEDKGNYTYSEIEEITVTFPDHMEAMQGAPIVFAPVVESSVKGVIKPDDPDYEYSCQFQNQWYDEDGFSHQWQDVNPEGTQAVNHTVNLSAKNYTVWYKVINKTTKVARNFQTNFNVKSATSEGWMVLCKDGADERARLDMIYTDASGKDCVFANIIKENSIKMYKPHSLMFLPSMYAAGDQIFITCDGPGYLLNAQTLAVNSSGNLQNKFITPAIASDIICYGAPYVGTGMKEDFTVCVTVNGDAYTIMTNSAGASFEYCMNSDKLGNDPTYKLAPFIGASETTGSRCCLLYDNTNKRFMGCCYTATGSATDRLLFPLVKPENALFDFTTGLDMVDMTVSTFSGGDVFSILQRPDGHRVVYVINIAGYARLNSFRQNGYYDNITSPDFDTAVDYAAHPQYNYMFWCKGNKVYSYNYVLGTIADEITLPAGETTSLVKFNRYRNLLMNPAYVKFKDDPEFLDMEKELIVGSSDGSENGGVVRFYKVSTQGKLELHKEYKGLGQEIVDVVYRERRL